MAGLRIPPAIGYAVGTMLHSLFFMLFAVLSATALGAADISGEWDLVWNTEGGVRRTVWNISQSGEKVTVKTGGAVLEGVFKDNRITVAGEFYAAEAGYSAPLKIEGSLEGDELKGKGSWDQYAMTFTAARSQ